MAESKEECERRRKVAASMVQVVTNNDDDNEEFGTPEGKVENEEEGDVEGTLTRVTAASSNVRKRKG